MIELVPQGRDARVLPGDFILCHRRGLVSSIIRWGEKLRRGDARWSHAAIAIDESHIVEALTRGVCISPLSTYRNTVYAVVRTRMSPQDSAQAVAFAKSCVGQRYGWGVIISCALRFLTPGRGLWFGMNGTEICSGLVAQALCRGWANFEMNPASMTPAELAAAYA